MGTVVVARIGLILLGIALLVYLLHAPQKVSILNRIFIENLFCPLLFVKKFM